MYVISANAHPSVARQDGTMTVLRAATPALSDQTSAGGSIGLVLGSAMYTAAVLGTGILLLPALAARAAGPASVVAVLAVLVLSVPLAGTFAALAARHPDSGGVATYVRLALGQTAARATGYWFFFGVSVGMPVIGLLAAEYIVAAAGLDRSAVYLIALAILVPPLLFNAVGLRLAGPVQLVLTAALVLLVVGAVALSLPQADASNWRPFLPNGWGGVGLAISLFVWAFAGWEAVTHIAGEFRHPRRTIPLATAIAIAVVGAAYLALQYVTVAVLGERAATSTVPLIDLVDTALPGAGRIGVTVIAVIVALGVMNAYAGAFAKLGASLGRDGDLPRWLGAGAEQGGVPRRALLLVAVLGLAYMTAAWLTGGNLEVFVLIHTSSMVAVYALGMVAAFRLLERYSPGWWMAIVAAVMVAGLLALAGPTLVVPLGLGLAAVAVTLVKRRLARTATAASGA